MIGSAATTLSGLVGLAPAVLLGRLIDDVTASTAITAAHVIGYLALFVSAALLGSVLSAISIMVSVRVTQDLFVDLRTEIASRLFAIPLISHFRRPPGASLTMLTDDVESLDNNVTDWILNAITSLVVGGGALALMIRYDPVLAGAACVIPPISYAVSSFVAPLAHRARFDRQTVFGDFVGAVQDRFSIDGLILVSSFGTAEEEVATLSGNARAVADATTNEAKYWELYKACSSTLAAVLPLGLWVLGGYRFQQGALTLGELVAIVSALLPRFIIASNQLSSLKPTIARARASLFRLEELVLELDGPGSAHQKSSDVGEQPPTLTPAGAPPGHSCDAVLLRDVAFRYPQTRQGQETGSGLRDRWALKGIDLVVAEGESVALVGHSGAGKTTLGLLIAGLLQPDQGEVELFGLDPAQLPARKRRELVRLVPQTPFLLHDTLAANIAYGLQVSTDELLAAADAASVDFIDRLPDGLDTVVGERGTRLSGGERQRIALARALLGNPRLLLLDEATSNLDAETQSLVLESLHKLAGRTTILVIAHRLSTVRACDRVVVLDAGCLVDQGPHDHLARTNNYYRRLVELELE